MYIYLSTGTQTRDFIKRKAPMAWIYTQKIMYRPT